MGEAGGRRKKCPKGKQTSESIFYYKKEKKKKVVSIHCPIVRRLADKYLHANLYKYGSGTCKTRSIVGRGSGFCLWSK